MAGSHFANRGLERQVAGGGGVRIRTLVCLTSKGFSVLPCRMDAHCRPVYKERSVFENRNRNRATGVQVPEFKCSVFRGRWGEVRTRQRERKASILNDVFIQQIFENNTFKMESSQPYILNTKAIHDNIFKALKYLTVRIIHLEHSNVSK